MPKSPILSRELYYDMNGDGSLRFIDWATVSTELGFMVESRSPLSVAFGLNPATNIDVIDISFNKIGPFNEGTFFNTFNTGGYSFPKDISSWETAPIKPAKHF